MPLWVRARCAAEGEQGYWMRLLQRCGALDRRGRVADRVPIRVPGTPSETGALLPS